MDDKIKNLKKYFEKREDVAMAFLFGSRASETTHLSSDWDIAVYLKSDGGNIEFEKKEKDFWKINENNMQRFRKIKNHLKRSVYHGCGKVWLRHFVIQS